MRTFLGHFAAVTRIILLTAWASIIVAALYFYFTEPQSFTAENIASFLQSFESQIWLIFLAMSVLRGFTLLPSTPLVVAGTILFPGQPFLVLGISIVGIILSSSMIYFFSDLLGFSAYFERKKPRSLSRIRNGLEKPRGVAFVAAWAFFPLVPTDAVCYVAGTARMHFPKFISAIFAGELLLCSVYVLSGFYFVGGSR